MTKFCLNCGAPNKDNAQFCEKCGYQWKQQRGPQNKKNGIIDKLFYKTDKNTGERKLAKGKTIIIAIVILFILLIIVSSFGGSTGPEKTIEVNGLSLNSEGYGLYTLTGTIIPDKDYSYLEAVVVFYDDSGAIIQKDPLVWNINDVQADQSIKLNGNAYISGDATPAKAEVYFFDNVFTGDDYNDAIYNQTIEM